MPVITEPHLPSQGLPVFLVSADAVVMEANVEAQSELKRGDTFSVDRAGKLSLSVMAATRRLHDSVGTIALQDAAFPRAILSLKEIEQSDNRFLILYRLAAASATDEVVVSSARVIISMRDPRAFLMLTSDMVSATLNLSPTEARVVLALANGKRLQEIAEEGGSKITTVRSQLAAAQRKTGTHSQIELVRLLLTLAY
jgi:DNA-binding CsgD family transcriptional regulator